jgi:hypothetical protein
MANNFVIPEGFQVDQKMQAAIDEFLAKYPTLEGLNKAPSLLMQDKKSSVFYLVCHLDTKTMATATDCDAILDPHDGEDYKLNRDLYTDTYAYKKMEEDAKKGRSFEDIIIEYDKSYRPEQPLKVFGGQHRINAIRESVKDKVSVFHGVRVYFNLTVEQRFEVASINNTSITVSNDLLDRMQEELLGPELRKWCQSVGLLPENENFADYRGSEGAITVRIARCLVVNYYRGKIAKAQPYVPMVCASGPTGSGEYSEVRKEIDWNDKKLIEMGKEFASLHHAQRQTVLGRATERHAEFANKALHPSIASSWAYAAGLFQNKAEILKSHYNITISVNPPSDPLNAEALVKARLKGIDPDTYRGLGSRISGDELGRMLEVFILQATKAQKPGITLKLANAAIQTYEAKKQQLRADKAIKGI